MKQSFFFCSFMIATAMTASAAQAVSSGPQKSTTSQSDQEKIATLRQSPVTRMLVELGGMNEEKAVMTLARSPRKTMKVEEGVKGTGAKWNYTSSQGDACETTAFVVPDSESTVVRMSLKCMNLRTNQASLSFKRVLVIYNGSALASGNMNGQFDTNELTGVKTNQYSGLYN